MSDRIVLAGMVFQARHGVLDWEKSTAQRFEVDVELVLDVQPAGLDDDLTRTVDYRGVYRVVQQVVEFDDVQPHRGPRRGDRPRDPRRAGAGGRGRHPGPQAGGPPGRPARLRRASRSGASEAAD